MKNKTSTDKPVLTVKHANNSHIDLIRTLCFQVWPQTYASILTPAQIDYMLDMMYSPASLQKQLADGADYMICYDGDEPAGFASLEGGEGGKFKLSKLYVLPNQQGKGTGRFLIDYIANIATQRGGSVLQLQVNKQNAAQHFYKKLGFTVAREAVFEIGNGFVMDDYIMELALPAQNVLR
jgi:ribosomal protein S18 acetylase RimI-like enzyme